MMGVMGHERTPLAELARLDQDQQRVLAALGQLVELAEQGGRGAAQRLASLIPMVEEQARMIEQLLQKSQSDALIGVRRSHEQLLLQLELLQEQTGQAFAAQLHRVAVYLPELLEQNVALLRRSADTPPLQSH